MISAASKPLSVRKVPRQVRARVTLDAICEATIQVLLAEGPVRLTTTKVALRAGVSVGSLYQYYPNKRSLFYAVTDRYLDLVAVDVERACAACHGGQIGTMTRVLIEAYWQAKMSRADVTRALYLVAVDLDTPPLIDAFTRRIEIATTAMFRTACDASIVDTALVNLTLLSALFGTVRHVFERNLPGDLATAACEQLVAMCQAYLRSVSHPS